MSVMVFRPRAVGSGSGILSCCLRIASFLKVLIIKGYTFKKKHSRIKEIKKPSRERY